MKSKNFALILMFFVLLITGMLPSNYYVDNDPPIPVDRPDEIPEHIVNPWTLLDFQFDDSFVDFGDRDPIITPRIVGGYAVSPQNKYPWMVTLEYLTEHYCGGSLIDKDWVITSAHCWTSADGAPFTVTSNDKVVLGEYSLSISSGHEQTINVSEVYIHPNYDPDTLEYDFALLKLASSATLNSYVKVIGMLHSNRDNLTEISSKIAGWGDVSYGGSSSDVLLEGDVNVLEDSSCANYGPFFEDSMICAGKDYGTVDSCQGDSGGPLFLYEAGNSYLIGVTSWGYQCGLEGYPGVYADLTYAFDWIESVSGVVPVFIPALTYPNNNGSIADTSPTFIWSTDSEPVYYEFIYSRYSNVSSPFVNKLNAGKFDTSFNFPSGYVYWKVRSVFSNGSVSAWSTTRSFYTGTNGISYPIITSPYQNYTTTDTSPTISWAYGGSYDSFELQISRYSTMDTPVKYYLTQTVYAPELEVGVWFYRVRANTSSGQSSWSEWRRINIVSSGLSAPAMYYPGASTVKDDLTPRFDWADIAGATSYNFQISRFSDFYQVEYDLNTGTTTEYTFSSPIDGGTIFWRVRAISNGTPGPWTEFRKHKIAENGLLPPQPLLPSQPGTASAGDVEFIWSTISGKTYELSITPEGGSETIYPYSSTSTILNLTPGVYIWKVRVPGGPWSQSRSLTIN